MSYHILSYHIISYHIISYHTIPYHTIPYHIISYHIIWYTNMLDIDGSMNISWISTSLWGNEGVKLLYLILYSFKNTKRKAENHRAEWVSLYLSKMISIFSVDRCSARGKVGKESILHMAHNISTYHSEYRLRQWVEALLCNASPHWPRLYLEWSLISRKICTWFLVFCCALFFCGHIISL